MIDGVLKTTVDGVQVEGKIVELTRTFIKVEITAPYITWTNCLIKSGPGAYPHPKNSFLLTYEETGTKLLANAYRKIKYIDDSIDRFCLLHDRLIDEIAAANEINDAVIRSSVIFKLEGWFFSQIFSKSVTGIIASYDEREKITEILEVYKESGVKIYLR